MNSLSWMIYLAEILDALKMLFIIGCLLSLVVMVVLFVIWINDEKNRYPMKNLKWYIGLTFACCLILSIITPSRQTTLLMAASQATEMAFKSPEAKTLLNSL